jgi:hypothetical protein
MKKNFKRTKKFQNKKTLKMFYSIQLDFIEAVKEIMIVLSNPN